MKKQLNKKTTSNTWTTNPKIVNTYINKYIIQRSSPIIEGVDMFDQIGNVNEEYETTSFNSDLLKKLIPQIKNNFTKTDFSVGIKFINLHNVGHSPQMIRYGDKIAQLVMIPVIAFRPYLIQGDLYHEAITISNRGDGALGSTDEKR